jgi:hypothetical protein
MVKGSEADLDGLVFTMLAAGQKHDPSCAWLGCLNDVVDPDIICAAGNYSAVYFFGGF